MDGDPDDLSVRTLIFGGEPVDAARVRGWLDRHPAVVAVNMFGITETTVHLTRAVFDRNALRTNDIGVPLPGTVLHLLDGALRPLLPGAVGEIYVAGPQVARIPGPSRTDGTALRGRPERRDRLPHRRPRPAAGRRRARVPWTLRRSAAATRPPRRAGGGARGTHPAA
ncbi:AMP-binding protein [Rhodococcus hoagii]|nr:AMP-binding protein [Prescottella equi]